VTLTLVLLELINKPQTGKYVEDCILQKESADNQTGGCVCVESIIL